MPQPVSALPDLTPFEQRLIRTYRSLRALRPSHRAVAAVLVVFTLNAVAMAASSVPHMRVAPLLVISALEAAVVTAICLVPGMLAYAFGFTQRVHHRWAVMLALFLAVASLASR